MLIPVEKLYIPFCCSPSQMPVLSFHIWGCFKNISQSSVSKLTAPRLRCLFFLSSSLSLSLTAPGTLTWLAGYSG